MDSTHGVFLDDQTHGHLDTAQGRVEKALPLFFEAFLLRAFCR